MTPTPTLPETTLIEDNESMPFNDDVTQRAQQYLRSIKPHSGDQRNCSSQDNALQTADRMAKISRLRLSPLEQAVPKCSSNATAYLRSERVPSAIDIRSNIDQPFNFIPIPNDNRHPQDDMSSLRKSTSRLSANSLTVENPEKFSAIHNISSLKRNKKIDRGFRSFDETSDSNTELHHPVLRSCKSDVTERQQGNYGSHDISKSHFRSYADGDGSTVGSSSSSSHLPQQVTGDVMAWGGGGIRSDVRVDSPTNWGMKEAKESLASYRQWCGGRRLSRQPPVTNSKYYGRSTQPTTSPLVLYSGEKGKLRARFSHPQTATNPTNSFIPNEIAERLSKFTIHSNPLSVFQSPEERLQGMSGRYESSLRGPGGRSSSVRNGPFWNEPMNPGDSGVCSALKGIPGDSSSSENLSPWRRGARAPSSATTFCADGGSSWSGVVTPSQILGLTPPPSSSLHLPEEHDSSAALDTRASLPLQSKQKARFTHSSPGLTCPSSETPVWFL